MEKDKKQTPKAHKTPLNDFFLCKKRNKNIGANRENNGIVNTPLEKVNSTSLRSEIRTTDVHIMLVCPGFVETNLQTRALGGDGRVTTHPQSMVGKPTSAEKVAEAICMGTLKKKRLLVLTPVGRLTYWMNRFAPIMYERLMARQLKDELVR